MPTATNGDVSLYYAAEGTGPTVAFVGEAGLGAWLWGWQHPAVAGPYEALVWDLRGTGRSDAPPPDSYSVEAFVADLEAVLSAHGARRVHLVGAGLGGMVALRYAREHGRAASLALLGTAASGAAVDADAYAALVADLTGAFSAAFREARPDLVERIHGWRDEEDAAPDAARAQRAAARAFEAGPLSDLAVPALVFHGVADPVVPVEAGRFLAGDLPRGRFEPVEGYHLAFVEHARAVNDELLAFLDDQEGR